MQEVDWYGIITKFKDDSNLDLSKLRRKQEAKQFRSIADRLLIYGMTDLMGAEKSPEPICLAVLSLVNLAQAIGFELEGVERLPEEEREYAYYAARSLLRDFQAGRG